MERATVLPALCIVAQGAKTVMLGREVYSYDASRLVAYAVDLPIAGQVTQASQREPFLVLVLKLDPLQDRRTGIEGLPARRAEPGQQPGRDRRPGEHGDRRRGRAPRRLDGRSPRRRSSSPPWSSTRSSFASCSVRSARVSPRSASRVPAVQRVAKAVSWVREHFAQPITLEDLAGLVHMSVSSFHQHFKAVTTMTPLQYQKVLRLQEARRLMLSRHVGRRQCGTSGGLPQCVAVQPRVRRGCSGARRRATSPSCAPKA